MIEDVDARLLNTAGVNLNLLAVMLEPVAGVPNVANPDVDAGWDPNPPNPPVAGAGCSLAAAIALIPNSLDPKDGAFVSPKLPKPVPPVALPKGVLALIRVGVGIAGDGEGTVVVAGTTKSR